MPTLIDIANHNPHVYLKLFHGRKDSNEDLKDWGLDGPVFGPLRYVQMTYGQVHFEDETEESHDLHRMYDMFYYDGVYYGDLSVFSPSFLDVEHGLKARVIPFDPTKAIPPHGN